ncbi:TetR/AcrR family transcriptional regulator [Ruthenibacterium lactatiformans]|uniref:TetR/AcrR family transcriptional regulator n=1 Tax=Ruthenibacterium lactatiformans TaxID=1550024 RepID=UPI0022E63851|nr:TetR/AcrR family transcriptional regulator [Ruthenibacterium lactatiformans]
MRQNEKTVSPMSNEGRNSYVIEHITDAILKLMREKPIEEISVSELCELAQVGRASFYRNFKSKEEIVSACIRDLFQEWTERYETGAVKSISQLVKELFRHLEAHREFYDLLNRQNLIYLIKDVITGMCGPKPEQSAMEAYACAYVAYTLYGWIEVWFQRGMKESPDEMAAMFPGESTS